MKGDDAAAWLGLAAVSRRQGDWAQEAQAYARAAALRPDDARIYADLGVAFEAQGLEANAEAAFREAVRLAPKIPITTSISASPSAGRDVTPRPRRRCARRYG